MEKNFLVVDRSLFYSEVLMVTEIRLIYLKGIIFIVNNEDN